MKAKLYIITMFFVLITLPVFAGLVFADGSTTMSVDEIVKKANHISLYQGTSTKGRVHLTITDKQGRTRERTLNILRLDTGKQDRDQKYLTYFKAPADVRKMVFMVHKHAALDKDDDRWLYMPGLDLVKRIAASDKRTSFVGSDFLYEDISGRSIDEDTHELINTTEKYYIIKNVPKKPETVEFAYYTAHIDKKSFIPVKTGFYKKDGGLYRVMEAVKVENINARENGKEVVYPTVIQSRVQNLENGSRTEMTFSNIKYNLGLGDKIFTERYLRRPPRDVMR
ncbi:MAG: outer membrane lipoprotein-sorting protein [Desulfobacteraceae bacterium]|nr:outer membrane lipoprotein-sorting protein [Desulfobacteraceae bacterium]